MLEFSPEFVRALSIIIPVYNVEDYLRRCVESILAQDYYNYEIILVDDGSTDSSGAICDELAREHSFIRVIHKSNGGQSSARNVGIEEAVGKYIWFIDSDDYIAPQCLALIMKQIEQNSTEILFFPYIRTNGVVTFGGSIGNYHEGEYSGKDILQYQLANISSCTFISEKKIWLENNLRYIDGIYFEDFEIWPRIMKVITRASFFNSSLIPYLYYIRVGSVMNLSDQARRMRQIDDFFRIEDLWRDCFNLHNPAPNSYDMQMVKSASNMLHRNLLNFVRKSRFSLSTKLKLYAEFRRKGVFSSYYNGYKKDWYQGSSSVKLFWNTIGRSFILFSLFSIIEEIRKKLHK
ncbi:glycosyltransferase family 2 protein [Porphyromonas circumdentaria]|uniref:Glycosyl transferase family 2 n=1 Tax=Porphyromonas circumdentaria TaxID=29524 RepID=A0A1T4KZ47_9PORP|nr:glycosyltransferase family 2 protein [Porphyromonas circumdentaria]MBB6275139.1 glycosyltransferase involved in cell wall biosynthesis [Porphyromonas circumdentaria]SJZ47590.1 Glycosyl transferase family 2 [Porphyromonas circumdentaria]